MHFQISDEQQQLADSLTRVLDDHYSFEQRRAIGKTVRGWSPEVWARLAQLGVTAQGLPEAYGGFGLGGAGGNLDRLPVMQAFGRALLLEPYLASCVLGATAVREVGSEAQKQALLPAVASGELRLAWAHDEADGRHEALWVETRARRTAAGWQLDGAKSLVLHAEAAGRLVVSARMRGEPGEEQGVALFLVDPHAPGVHLRPYRLIDDTPAGELRLQDAPAELLSPDVGAERDPTRSNITAAAAIRTTLAAGTAAACADMVGAMERAFTLTTAYVNTRKQFGRLIGEYQALRHRVAEMAVNLEMARSMAIAAAVAADEPDSPNAAADLPRAKLVIGRYARALCHAAIQSHGGIGMTEEYAVGHCLRRVHVMDQLFGDGDAQVGRLVRLATLPDEGLSYRNSSDAA